MIHTTETELRTLLRDIIPFIYINNTSIEKFFDICVEIAKRYDYIAKSDLEMAEEIYSRATTIIQGKEKLEFIDKPKADYFINLQKKEIERLRNERK